MGELRVGCHMMSQPVTVTPCDTPCHSVTSQPPLFRGRCGCDAEGRGQKEGERKLNQPYAKITAHPHTQADGFIRHPCMPLSPLSLGTHVGTRSLAFDIKVFGSSDGSNSLLEWCSDLHYQCLAHDGAPVCSFGATFAGATGQCGQAPADIQNRAQYWHLAKKKTGVGVPAPRKTRSRLHIEVFAKFRGPSRKHCCR